MLDHFWDAGQSISIAQCIVFAGRASPSPIRVHMCVLLGMTVGLSGHDILGRCIEMIEMFQQNIARHNCWPNIEQRVVYTWCKSGTVVYSC